MRREEVVEVVGDAARQASDGVQLLRVEELLLESLPLGDVLDEGDCVRELAVRAADGRAGQTAPAHRAVGVEEALLEVVAVERAVAKLPVEAHVGLDVLGVREVGEGNGRELVRVAPEQLLDGPVHLEGLALGADERDAQARVLEDGAEAGLALGERRLGALAVGDVDHDAAEEAGLAGGVPDDVHEVAEPDLAEVGGDHPVLVLVVAARGDLAGGEGERRLPVVRVQMVAPEAGCARPLLDAVAEDVARARAHERRAVAVEIGLPDDRLQVVDEAHEAGVAASVEQGMRGERPHTESDGRAGASLVPRMG